MISRSLFTFAIAASLVASHLVAPSLYGQTVATPAASAAKAAPAPDLSWHDVTTWGLEGRAWTDAPRKRWFQRMPDAAEGKVTDAVWRLSQDSAGMMVRFKTDATSIWGHFLLQKDKLAMPHMPATGVSGLDLYARDDQGKWRWVNMTRTDKQEMKLEIIGELARGFREYAIYLPLYNGIESLSIGVPVGAKFEKLAPRTQKPIVFYGTSITHGASASRPGMVHTAILGRRFDWPVVNLGFSGNGRMDAAVGEFLVKIDAAVYVIDCLPNMTADQVREKGPALVKQIRAAQPDTPIVLVEDRRNTNSWILPKREQHHTDNHAALRDVYAGLKKEGVGGLYYIAGDNLLGDDTEGATDGSHPNDLGFMRQADAFAPVLEAVLQQ